MIKSPHMRKEQKTRNNVIDAVSIQTYGGHWEKEVLDRKIKYDSRTGKVSYSPITMIHKLLNKEGNILVSIIYNNNEDFIEIMDWTEQDKNGRNTLIRFKGQTVGGGYIKDYLDSKGIKNRPHYHMALKEFFIQNEKIFSAKVFERSARDCASDSIFYSQFNNDKFIERIEKTAKDREEFIRNIEEKRGKNYYW